MTTTATPHRDNMLGVCHALGTTFGFDPLIPRLLLMLGLLLDFEAAAIAYAVCGLAVAAAAVATRIPHAMTAAPALSASR